MNDKPYTKIYKKFRAKKMRIGGEGKRKENCVLLILVSNLQNYE